MSKLDDVQEKLDVVIEIKQWYEQIEEQTEEFMTEQDSNMKKTTLGSIQRDLERYQEYKEENSE
jgi:hypothetical protein